MSIHIERVLRRSHPIRRHGMLVDSVWLRGVSRGVATGSLGHGRGAEHRSA